MKPKELAEQLGKTAMHIGRVRKEVCNESDMDGKDILPSGVNKILAFFEKEMEAIETATVDIVKVQVLPLKTANPRFIFAKDLERKVKVRVGVPKNRKPVLDNPRTIHKAERGSEDGEFFYKWVK
jgi:hypothetical protein